VRSPRGSRRGLSPTIGGRLPAALAYQDRYIRTLTVPFLGRERAPALPGRLGRAQRRAARGGLGLAGIIDESARGDRGGPDATRSRGGPGLAWIPDERIDLAAMLAAYTIGGAW